MPNPSALRSQIKSLETQKGEVVSGQKEAIKGAISEILNNIAKIKQRASELKKIALNPQLNPAQKAQIREQLSYLNNNLKSLEAKKKRLLKQRASVEIQVAVQFKVLLKSTKLTNASYIFSKEKATSKITQVFSGYNIFREIILIY